MDFPDLITVKILDNLYKIDNKSILNLINLNKNLDSFCDLYIYKLYSTLNIKNTHEKYMNNYDLTIVQRVKLILNKKCQKCQKTSKTKIYYPYPIRLCCKCFENISINIKDLLDLYNVKWNAILFYKSKQNNKYVLKKEIETFYGLKLEEIHLNDFKKEIATKLNISTEQLSLYSTLYVKEDYPQLSLVEAEYYTNIYKENLLNYAKNNNIPNNHDIIKKYKKYLTNKKDYELWFNKLNFIRFEYERFLCEEKYESIIFMLQNICNNKSYFSELKLQNIPNINNLLFILYNNCINNIENDTIIKDIKEIIKNFIEINIIIIDNFDDNLANNIANNMLKYPDKELFLPKYDPKIFIKKYTEIIYNYPLILINNDDISWENVYNIIKIEFYDKICKHCNKKFSSKENRIKHEYNSHLKYKFKEDIVLFNEDDKKSNYIIFDQPIYINNKIECIVDKYSNMICEKTKNYISITKI